MRTQLLALAVAGVAVSGAPSYAAMCAGTAATARVCVNKDVSVTPTGGPVSYHDCVVVGDPDMCVPVGVDTPNVAVTGTGSVVTTECTACGEVPDPGVDLSDCDEAVRDWSDDPPSTSSGTRLRTAIQGCVLD